MAFFKIVPYAKDDAMQAYFSLSDIHTNQVSANGIMKVKIYTQTSIAFSVEGGASGSGLQTKNILLEGSFPIARTNFVWETSGSMSQTEELLYRFYIPYSSFTKPFTRGKVATLELDFKPEGDAESFKGAVRFSLY